MPDLPYFTTADLTPTGSCRGGGEHEWLPEGNGTYLRCHKGAETADMHAVDDDGECLNCGLIHWKPRRSTPAAVTTHPNGIQSTRLTLKRHCNGCGTELGDADGRDVGPDGSITDATGECPICTPASKESGDA